MRILNAGVDPIRFTFNHCFSANPKLGGMYILDPGQEQDIPEEAESLIHHQESGPGLHGVVILPYGCNVTEKRIEGLRNQLAFTERSLLSCDDRREDLRMVGRTVTGTPPHERVLQDRVKRIKTAIRDCEKLLESEFADGHTPSTPPARAGQSRRRGGSTAAALDVPEAERLAE